MATAESEVTPAEPTTEPQPLAGYKLTAETTPWQAYIATLEAGEAPAPAEPEAQA